MYCKCVSDNLILRFSLSATVPQQEFPLNQKTFTPMNQTQSSSLQPGATSSAPQSQTQQPQGQQTQPSEFVGPHTSAAPLSPSSSTSQPGATAQRLVSGSHTNFNLAIFSRHCHIVPISVMRLHIHIVLHYHS